MYFIEDLSGVHASTMLICRFINFIKSIKKSPKLAVQFLYQKVKNNVNTVTGKNIKFVVEATGYEHVEDIETNEVKKKLKFCENEADNSWKTSFIKEIVNLKHNVLYLDEDSDQFETEDLDFLLEFLSTS